MSEGLEKLFGSTARVKLLRLFLFNPKLSFTMHDVVVRARITEEDARREVALLERAGLIGRVARGKGIRYGLDHTFEYTEALQNLLLNAPQRAPDILARVRGTGSLRLVVLSGIFMGEWENRLDVLIVADRVKERVLRERFKQFEAEIGKEIRYALLPSDDFYYRLNMNDKLVRDVLDYPHQIALDKLNIGLK